MLIRSGVQDVTHGIICRGSLGFGEDALQSLPGNIGTHDVADCIAALDEAIAQGIVLQSSTTQRAFLSIVAASSLPTMSKALHIYKYPPNTFTLKQYPLV